MCRVLIFGFVIYAFGASPVRFSELCWASGVIVLGMVIVFANRGVLANKADLRYSEMRSRYSRLLQSTIYSQLNHKAGLNSTLQGIQMQL